MLTLGGPCVICAAHAGCRKSSSKHLELWLFPRLISQCLCFFCLCFAFSFVNLSLRFIQFYTVISSVTILSLRAFSRRSRALCVSARSRVTRLATLGTPLFCSSAALLGAEPLQSRPSIPPPATGGNKTTFWRHHMYSTALTVQYRSTNGAATSAPSSPSVRYSAFPTGLASYSMTRTQTTTIHVKCNTCFTAASESFNGSSVPLLHAVIPQILHPAHGPPTRPQPHAARTAGQRAISVVTGLHRGCVSNWSSS